MQKLLKFIIVTIVGCTSWIYSMDEVFKQLSQVLPPLSDYRDYDDNESEEETVLANIVPVVKQESNTAVIAAKALVASQFDRTQLERVSSSPLVDDSPPSITTFSTRSSDLFNKQLFFPQVSSQEVMQRNWRWGPSFSEDGLPPTAVEKIVPVSLQIPPPPIKSESSSVKYKKRKRGDAPARRSVRARHQLIAYSPHEPCEQETGEKLKPSYSIEGGGYQCKVCKRLSNTPPTIHIVCKHFVGVKGLINLFKCKNKECGEEFHSLKASNTHRHATMIKPNVLKKAHALITFLEA